MEDTHIVSVKDLGPGVSFFGVFDGHGGKSYLFCYNHDPGSEVALFVKAHFIEELVKLRAFKEKEYKQALTTTFLLMDELMKHSKKELASYSNDPQKKGFGGCTATVVLITETEIYCANAGDPDKAMEWMQKLRADPDAEPNAVSYSALIDAHAKVGDHLAAAESLQQMLQMQLQPTF